MISIIIPIYNAEKYIGKCIESVLAQTYKDFELILIDDGSKDNSKKICDEYACADSRITVISQANSGVSAARNRGIKEAKGEYISFIDADDWVEPSLLENFEGDDADLIVQSYKNWYEGNDSYCNNIINVHDLASQDIGVKFKIIEENNYLKAPFAKLFKRNIISDNHIQFPSHLKIGEDHLFVLNYINNSKTIRLVDKYSYVYAHRCAESLSSGKIDLTQYYCYTAEAYSLRNEIRKKLLPNDNGFERFVIDQYAANLLTYTSLLFRQNESNKTAALRRIMEQHGKVIKESQNIPRFYKLIRALISTDSPRFVEFCLSILYKMPVLKEKI